MKEVSSHLEFLRLVKLNSKLDCPKVNW